MDKQMTAGTSGPEKIVTAPNTIPEKPELEIMVSADEMSAYARVVSVAASDLIVEEEDVLAKLAEKGVKYGISMEDIERFRLAKDHSLQRYKVAYGLRPIDGEDGKYTLLFQAERSGPKVREDGKVDFKELGLIQNVHKDDLVCTIIPPVPGEDGIDVYGKPVKARVGAEAKVSAGKNVCLSDDGTQMLAEVEGSIKFDRNTVFVEEVYHVKGDVGLKTGHVIFNGSVRIDGNVIEGFDVTAQKDIYIGGRVEGANIKAGGNIVIAAGISGMGVSLVQAGGDVKAKFIERAEVHSGGSVYSDIILRSTVKAEESVILKGEKAAILGGKTLAGEKIIVRNLGSDLNLHQEVAVQKDWKSAEANEKGKTAQESRQSLEQKLATAETYLEMYVAKLKEQTELGVHKDVSAMREYMIKKTQAAAVVASLKATLDQMKEAESVSNIICTGTVYPGVKISIDYCRMSITVPMQNQKFYVYNGEIVLGAVLPGEGNH